MKKISTIVPVFNTERYVRSCIDSIISQTYSNWELILVDDGSQDNSLSILREYEKRDLRIKVIHQNNSGPGIARNTGIKQAIGDYIVFVDADDLIKPNYFEQLSKETADIVFIDIDQVDENLNILREEHMSSYMSLSKDEFLRWQMTGKILWGGVRKAVKKELLYKNNILFTDHQVGEEAVYSFLLLFHAKTVSFINGSVYLYVHRQGSQSDTKKDDPWGDIVSVLKKKTIELNVYEIFANTLNAFVITATVVSLDKSAHNYSYREYRIKAIDRINRCKQDIDKNYYIDYKSMPIKVILTYPLIKYCMPKLFFLVSKLYMLIR